MEKVRQFLFRNGAIRQTMIKNTFWVAAGTTITKIIRFITIIYIARTLGTEGYGIFTYALSLIGIFTLFSDIGLTNILTRELSRREDSKDAYLSTATIVKIIFLIITIALVAIFAPLIAAIPAAKPLIIILAVTIAFESLRSFFYAITRSQNKMEVEAGLGILSEILITACVLFVFFKNPSPSSLAWSYLIGNGVSLLITFYFIRKYASGIFRNFHFGLVKPIIRSAWPFAIMGVFGVLMTNIDSVIIAFFGDAHILGLYAAAQRPMTILYILPGFLSVSIFPIINQLSHSGDNGRLASLIKKMTVMSLAVAIPIIVGGIIVAGPIINVIFGFEFIGAVLTFQILLLSLIVIFPGALWADLILAEDKQKVFIKSSLFGAITNITLDLILIPMYGIAGSAVATVAAQIVVNSIFLREIRKTVKFPFVGDLKKIIFTTIVMGAVAYILKIYSVPLIVIVLVSTIIYFGLLYILKDKIIEDIKQSLTPSPIVNS